MFFRISNDQRFADSSSRSFLKPDCKEGRFHQSHLIRTIPVLSCELKERWNAIAPVARTARTCMPDLPHLRRHAFRLIEKTQSSELADLPIANLEKLNVYLHGHLQIANARASALGIY